MQQYEYLITMNGTFKAPFNMSGDDHKILGICYSPPLRPPLLHVFCSNSNITTICPETQCFKEPLQSAGAMKTHHVATSNEYNILNKEEEEEEHLITSFGEDATPDGMTQRPTA